MALKYSKGIYTPKNPQKYVGKGSITYRSSWENTFCQFCDNNDNVLEWASESIRIPYKNPITGKQSTYVPDFLVRYKTKNDLIKTELVEIKPYDQSIITEKTKPKLRATVAINHAKWAAALAFCKRSGIVFRILTEKDMFR